MFISVIMLGLLLGLVTQSSRIWQQISGQKNNREAARILLELMGNDLQSAVLPPNNSAASPRFRINPSTISTTNDNPQVALWQADRSGTGATNGDVEDVGYFVRWVKDSSNIAHGTLNRLIIPPTNSSSIFQSQIVNTGLLTTWAPGLSVTTGTTAYKGLLADDVMGFWIVLYMRNSNPVITTGSSYDSASSPFKLPAYADISIAMLDPAIARRLTMANLGAMVTNYYSVSGVTNASSFVNALPANVRAGAESFQTRVQIRAGQ